MSNTSSSSTAALPSIPVGQTCRSAQIALVRGVDVAGGIGRRSSTALPAQTRHGFSLIEVMLVVALLSLIVIALMGVFSTTQRAFRASITQTDVLEGGRAAMDLVAGDLRELQASSGYTNGAVNFWIAIQSGSPLVQSLVASSATRTNVLESIFILTRENLTWTGTGYVVDTDSTSAINPLYRFTISTNTAAADPVVLYNAFASVLSNGAYTNMSHLVDGVVQFRVRAYDTNGVWMNYGYTNADNFATFTPVLGETSFYMFSNTLPAAVEIEMGVLEDRTLQRAESRPAGPLRDAYLSQQAGQVHLFRQRVTIPNVDPAAYQ